MKHRILLDNVALQLGSTGIARYWELLLRNVDSRGLADVYELEFLYLNRSEILPFNSFKGIDFPEFDFRFPAADRLLISETAKNKKIDVFCSSYYTSSCMVKNLLFVYDFIPEVFGFSELNRGWIERKIALLNASSYITISKNTNRDLHKFYPESTKKNSVMIYPGLEQELFSKPTLSKITKFKEMNGLRDYYVTLGSRYGQNGYKNGEFLQSALESLLTFDFDILFIGGEEINQRDRKIASQLNCKIMRLDLNDAEMVIALGGAEALIYPSLYEGFGLPPLESLAVGVPVICTNRASVSESTGGLNVSIEGLDHHEFAQVLAKGISFEIREEAAERGPVWAAGFSWDKSADAFCQAIKREAEREISQSETKKMKLFSEYTEAAVFVQTR
jgi:glycosyltransferase involved in cell wall biosynthesis